jgi:ribose 5-phosphate isomerase B
MKIFIGADHRGFKLKEQLKIYLSEKGYSVEDCGNTIEDPDDDYPDFAEKVARNIQQTGRDGLGIVICGSGIGVSVVANKLKGIRCAVGINKEQVAHGREADDINMLSLASDFTSLEMAHAMVDAFLGTSYKKSEERFNRRLGKVEKLEGNN